MESWMLRFRRNFQVTFRSVYEVDECDLSEYFGEIFLPYVPYFAFGERLVILSGINRAGSLPRAYQQFAERLADLDYPWQSYEEADENVKREEEILSSALVA